MKNEKRNLSNEQIQEITEMRKSLCEGGFKGHIYPHGNEFVPTKITTEIINATGTPYGAKIAVFFSLEMACDLSLMGFTDVTLLVPNKDFIPQLVSPMETHALISYETIESNLQTKFDFGTGNGPFSKDGVDLYPKMFALVLKMAKQVAMIQPHQLKNGKPHVKNHVALVQKHATFISRDIGNQFKSTPKEISFVIADLETSNPVVDTGPDRFAMLENLFPERKRLEPFKCSAGLALSAFQKGKTFKILSKLGIEETSFFELDPTSLTRIDNPFKKEPTIRKGERINSKFVVATNFAPNKKGEFQTMIVENDGSVGFSTHINVYGKDSLEEAEKLVAHFNTPEIKGYVLSLLEAKNTTNLTKEMALKLPTYA